jgi:hypothetical protein
MDWLSVGAGAAGGLDDLLSRLLKQEALGVDQGRLAETVRSNQAQEALRGRDIDETSSLRRLQQEMLNESRRQMEESRLRDDVRTSATQVPIGSVLQPPEYERNVKYGVSPQLYQQQEPSPPSLEEAGPEFTGPTRVGGFRFLGTEEQQQRREMNEAMNRFRGLNYDTAAHREGRLTEWGPPMIRVGDPNEPSGAVYQPRGSVAPGSPVPQPAAATERINAYKDSLRRVNKVLSAPPEAWQGIGFFAGPLGSLGARVIGSRRNPAAEELRTGLMELFATAAFREGGKQLTGPEREIFQQILADPNMDASTARVRLQRFKNSSIQTLKGLGVDTSEFDAGDERVKSLYERFLQRQQRQ